MTCRVHATFRVISFVPNCLLCSLTTCSNSPYLLFYLFENFNKYYLHLCWEKKSNFRDPSIRSPMIFSPCQKSVTANFKWMDVLSCYCNKQGISVLGGEPQPTGCQWALAQARGRRQPLSASRSGWAPKSCCQFWCIEISLRQKIGCSELGLIDWSVDQVAPGPRDVSLPLLLTGTQRLCNERGETYF